MQKEFPQVVQEHLNRAQAKLDAEIATQRRSLDDNTEFEVEFINKNGMPQITRITATTEYEARKSVAARRDCDAIMQVRKVTASVQEPVSRPKIDLDLSGQERDALLAALKLLEVALKEGLVRPNDGDIGDLLTNGGEHEGLTPWRISALADRIVNEYPAPSLAISDDRPSPM